MKPKHQRMWFFGVSFAVFAACVAWMLVAFEDQMMFFVTPSELAAQPNRHETLRIGGLVMEKSLIHTNANDVRFELSDGAASIPVTYTGALPALFREGQGAVAEGHMQNGTFIATRILAKHDENYMPAEVVESLKRSGHWHQLPPAARGGKP